MLQSIKQLYGTKLGASDGEFGHVKDFYFDDQSWVIRYLVVDTGFWLPGRKVLITPHCFGTLHQTADLLLVDLTRKQIEESPSIESHKPVSRQFEEEYYHYYGLPCYWQGDGMWGMSGYPIMERSPDYLTNGNHSTRSSEEEIGNNQLRSTEAVAGYQLEGSDGRNGHLSDFMIDVQSWAIRQLVIKIGHLFSREVHILPEKVERISYEESVIFVRMTKEAIEDSPEQHLGMGSYGQLTSK